MKTKSDPPPPGSTDHHVPLARLIAGLLHQETARFWTCRSLGYPSVLLAPAALNKTAVERQKPVGMWLISHLAVCAAIANTRGHGSDAIDLYEALLREICFGPSGLSAQDNGDHGRNMTDWLAGFRHRSGILRGHENPFDPRIAPLQHDVIGALLADVDRGLEIARIAFEPYMNRRAVLARWIRTRDAKARRLRCSGGAVVVQMPGRGDRCTLDLTPALAQFTPDAVAGLLQASQFPIHPLRQVDHARQFGVPPAVRVVVRAAADSYFERRIRST